jgi:predicted dehydrogenase/threonine dehydrogenase-like Zn-dependent dehydrogenase
MKQIVFKKGAVLAATVEPPALPKKSILVQVKASCLSPGTEMSSLETSGKSLIEKAKSHPEKLKAAIDRIKAEGVNSVVKKAINNANQEMLCGYSASGIVRDVGTEAYGFYKGMRVAVAGAGYANHAEIVAIPTNLAIPIPKCVEFKEASTCALGGIALQGVRRAEVSIGEINAVIGCGAIGLLTVQLLKAAGCAVVAIDLDSNRLRVAKKVGADFIVNGDDKQIIERVFHFTDGYGVDKVIITANTKSNDVLTQAFRISRKKGRIVLVGVIGNEFNRNEMYAKELDFVISTSYGPGRYDEQYERFGNDYPYAYVRWTEKRNMQAYLKFISSGAVKLDNIIEDTFHINDAQNAYFSLKDKKLLLATFEYTNDEFYFTKENVPAVSSVVKDWKSIKNGVIRLGLLGAGSFVQNTHVPNIKLLKDYYKVEFVCNQSGISARNISKQFPKCKDVTNYDELLNSDIDCVIIGTRHDTHADFAIRALKSGKAVFVEKPMSLNYDEYHELCAVVEKTEAPFMVGYNRRFSPFVMKIKEHAKKRINPMIIQYTMNAGYIPPNVWVNTQEGGGRIVGEACHIIDLFRYIIGYPAVSVSVDFLEPKTGSIKSDDNLIATIKYEDGSIGTMLYTAIGSKNAGKESMNVFFDEQVFELQDYKCLRAYGVSCDLVIKKQDKGHFNELKIFASSLINNRRFPINWDQLKETWEITRKISDSVR